MKFYELTLVGLEPFLPPLYRQVRMRLLKLIKANGGTAKMLDVGGRKSPYTVNLPARITIIDLPRQSELQEQLKLGISDAINEQTRRRRSNIDEIVFGDMTRSDLPDESYDLVVAVEVLEHVEKDALFVSEVYRVLKPGGAFVMTTPNGDWVENKNPDHKRHYQHQQLAELLSGKFESVSVEYAIRGGRYRKYGLKSWSVRKPVRTALSMFGNAVNSIQSADANIREQAAGTHHLIAIAKKI